MNDRIPIIADYRGVGLHDQQDAERLDVVRRDIDQVFTIGADIRALVSWIENRSRAPESRLLAMAFINAEFEEAGERRRTAPAVDRDKLIAMTFTLDSTKYRSKTFYCSWLLPRPRPGNHPENPVRRAVPLA